jgi:hypothetical protein
MHYHVHNPGLFTVEEHIDVLVVSLSGRKRRKARADVDIHRFRALLPQPLSTPKRHVTADILYLSASSEEPSTAVRRQYIVLRRDSNASFRLCTNHYLVPPPWRVDRAHRKSIAMVMQSTQLLLLSCSVSALLPILGWVGHVDLSWGTFYYAPLILLPQHLALYFRMIYLKHSPGPLDMIVLHLLLVTYILGTLFTTSRTILGLARGECSAGTAACLLMARLWIVLIMQSIASVGECTMLGMLVWRARYGGIASEGEHGAVYLPTGSADAENSSGRAWAAPSGMPTSINDVQVSFTV